VADWQVADVGDYNGDGKADILWRNANTHEVTIWESKPGATGVSFDATDFGYVSPDWRIAAK
jgi:hypothetical protein